MAYYAFLDVDKTLLLADENGNQFINQHLLDQLKTYGYLNIYLFTNMTLTDHEIMINAYDMRKSSPDQPLPVRISRYEIVAELRSQGFDVLGVITPADVGYREGIGAAYDQFYVPIYKSLQRKIKKDKLDCEGARKDHHLRNQQFKNLIPSIPDYYKEKSQQLAGQKYNMLTYVIGLCDRKLTTHILYIDDDRSCLKAVKKAQKLMKNKIKLTTVQVLENGELDNVAALRDFYTPALAIAKLKQAEAACGKTQTSIKEFIKHVNQSCMIDLKSVDTILVEFIDDYLERKKRPTPFLATLLSIMSGTNVTVENFYERLKALFNHSPLSAVSSFGIFSFETTPVASSSSAPSNPPTPK